MSLWAARLQPAPAASMNLASSLVLVSEVGERSATINDHMITDYVLHPSCNNATGLHP